MLLQDARMASSLIVFSVFSVRHSAAGEAAYQGLCDLDLQSCNSPSEPSSTVLVAGLHILSDPDGVSSIQQL